MAYSRADSIAFTVGNQPYNCLINKPAHLWFTTPEKTHFFFEDIDDLDKQWAKMHSVIVEGQKIKDQRSAAKDQRSKINGATTVSEYRDWARKLDLDWLIINGIMNEFEREQENKEKEEDRDVHKAANINDNDTSNAMEIQFQKIGIVVGEQ